jgi:hypothetical protein
LLRVNRGALPAADIATPSVRDMVSPRDYARRRMSQQKSLNPAQIPSDSSIDVKLPIWS